MKARIKSLMQNNVARASVEAERKQFFARCQEMDLDARDKRPQSTGEVIHRGVPVMLSVTTLYDHYIQMGFAAVEGLGVDAGLIDPLSSARTS